MRRISYMELTLSQYPSVEAFLAARKAVQVDVAKGIVRWLEARPELLPTITIAWDKSRGDDKTAWRIFRDNLWNSMGGRLWLAGDCVSPDDHLWYYATQRAYRALHVGTFDLEPEGTDDQ
jgi:hypothetical protein